MTRHAAAVLALLAAVAALPACGRGAGADRPDTISRERFVAANLALRSIADSTTGVDSVRAAALAEMEVTPAQLRAFVERHGKRTGFMAEVWTELADSMRRADSLSLERPRRSARDRLSESEAEARLSDPSAPPTTADMRVETMFGDEPEGAETAEIAPEPGVPPSAGVPSARIKPEPPPSGAPAPPAERRRRLQRLPPEGDTVRAAEIRPR